ncbi:MAG: sigma-70 family RNA polymerase sigma factor [Lachnospiraceae bacterium]|jgi:RNA polymerase sigma-70 factor (ECF subfamily)|nr:sigma-70 family RNA polymerase sigma factor [Lachnospiraceae bacterium]
MGSEGAKESFEDVYNRYYQPVYRLIFQRVGSREQAQDLASDVFYACYKHFDRFDPAKASMSTWIYTIANNKLKNYYRTRSGAGGKVISLYEESMEQAPPRELTFEEDMDGAIYLEEMRRYVKQALEALPERERKIVVERYFEELSSWEIAKNSELTPGNVRVILTRALKKMAVYFERNGIAWEF